MYCVALIIFACVCSHFLMVLCRYYAGFLATAFYSGTVIASPVLGWDFFFLFLFLINFLSFISFYLSFLSPMSTCQHCGADVPLSSNLQIFLLLFFCLLSDTKFVSIAIVFHDNCCYCFLAFFASFSLPSTFTVLSIMKSIVVRGFSSIDTHLVATIFSWTFLQLTIIHSF